jgi:hypothetical protein
MQIILSEEAAKEDHTDGGEAKRVGGRGPAGGPTLIGKRDAAHISGYREEQARASAVGAGTAGGVLVGCRWPASLVAPSVGGGRC